MNKTDKFGNDETPRYSNMNTDLSSNNNPTSKSSPNEDDKNYYQEDRKFNKRYDEEPKEIIKYRDRGAGCVKGCGCRTLSCSGCLLVILLVIGSIYVVLSRPPVIWNTVVNFLNNSVQIPQFNGMSAESAKNQINSSAQASGYTSVSINENQLTAIVRENFKQLDNAIVDIEPNTIRIYWSLEKTIPNNPLIGVIEIKMGTDGKLNLTKVGTEKIALPDFMNQLVSNLVPSVLSISSSDKDKTQVIYNLLSSNQSFQIKNVKLEKDNLILEISIDLFNQ